MITLNGTDNVVIDNFNLTAVCKYGTGIRLMNGTNNVTISNNDIDVRVPGSNSTSVVNKGIYATDPGLLTIVGNTILGGRRGVQVEGATGVVTIGAPNTTGSGASNLMGNVIAGAYEYGISLVDADGAMVGHNTIDMRGDYVSSVAINGNLLNGFTFDSNLLIDAGRAGIQLNNSNNGVGASQSAIVNNRIGLFQASSKAYGVYAYSVSDVNVYHNSVKIDQATANTGMVLKGSGYDVRNNILVAAGVPLSSAKASLDELRNNAYYNSNGGSIASINGAVADVAGLAAKGFVALGSFDDENPNFTTGTTFSTSLRTQNIDLANVSSADLLVGVDFESQARAAQSVDLGADEFSGITRLMASTATLDADVYPNPFSSALTVKLNSAEASEVQVTLTDLMGRVITTQHQGVEAGASSLKVNVEQSLPQGVYLLQVTQGDATSTFRVVKQ